MAAGWNVRVTTFDSEGRPGIARYFLAYEPDKERAIEMVRKRVSRVRRGGGGSCHRSDSKRTSRPKDETRRCKAAWLDPPALPRFPLNCEDIPRVSVRLTCPALQPDGSRPSQSTFRAGGRMSEAGIHFR